jgi:hypothetical protein
MSWSGWICCSGHYRGFSSNFGSSKCISILKTITAMSGMLFSRFTHEPDFFITENRWKAKVCRMKKPCQNITRTEIY